MYASKFPYESFHGDISAVYGTRNRIKSISDNQNDFTNVVSMGGIAEGSFSN